VGPLRLRCVLSATLVLISRGRHWRAAKSLDHGLIPETVEAYTLALAFPANSDQPVIWWEAANLYLSQGSYEGALSILDRIILDFPDYTRINSVLICRAAVYRRMQCVMQLDAFVLPAFACDLLSCAAAVSTTL
jgi:tetratricopeptide (TPR) repeat protein